MRVALEQATIESDQARQQLDDLRNRSEQEHADARSDKARAAELTAKLDELQHQRESEQRKRQALQEQSQQNETELQQRIESLEEEITRPAASDDSDASELENTRQELKRKSHRISEVARHLRRRKHRLQRVHTILQQRRSSGGTAPAPSTPSSATRSQLQQHSSVMRKVEEDRHQLMEVREMLAASERRMVKRWARPRAVATVGWFVCLAAVIAVGSWFASDHYFPATIAASAMLEADNKSHQPLTEPEAQQWSKWHTELFQDQGFHKVLARRLGDRRMPEYGTPQAIAEKLEAGLTLDSAVEGRMTLTLAGTDEKETTALLDVITTTVAQQSREFNSRRGGNRAWAVPAGGRAIDGQLSYARLNPVPIKDERLLYVLPIFGGSFVVIMLIVAICYGRLARAKRIFDDDQTDLTADASLGTV